ncbi:MAG: T9SS type A sorting domain-containing protein, partial [Cytophagales bacterium]|nr:T9SS type A sorting domain-containing protein [Cytophagales bacterium]
SRIATVLPTGTISVSAYPNPFGGTFNLLINSGNSDNRFDAIIYDLSSKPVSVLNNILPGTPISLGEGLSSGVYVIKVIGGGQVITQKLEKLE